MKQVTLFLIKLFLLGSIHAYAQEDTFQLNGKINTQYDDNQIMLFTFRQDTIYSVDTTVIKNGAFYFQGKAYTADFSIVTTGNYPDTVLSAEIILDKGPIYVEFDTINRVWGGALNDKLRHHEDSLGSLHRQMNNLPKDTAQSTIKKWEIINAEFRTCLYAFMTDNKDNILGVSSFSNYIGAFIWDSVQFNKLCDIFDKDRESYIVKAILEYKTKIEQRMQTVGKKYDDFEFRTPEGDTKKISDYVGKSTYVFIDFWASWCGPCIADMPYLKEVYEKYKNYGFEVVGISLDTDKKSWLRALDKINTPWEHLCNFEGLDGSKLAVAYHIKGIPYGLLIDKEGIIIEVNLRGATLDQKLHELFDKSQE